MSAAVAGLSPERNLEKRTNGYECYVTNGVWRWSTRSAANNLPLYARGTRRTKEDLAESARPTLEVCDYGRAAD